MVTLDGAGQNMTMRVHEVSAHRGTSQSALLVRKSSEGRRLEAVYVAGLNATLYLNTSSDGPHTRMEQLPISCTSPATAPRPVGTVPAGRLRL